MNNTETKQQPTIIKLLAPNGLGFGEGGIGIKEQIEQEILTESSLEAIHEHLTTDPEAFKKIDDDIDDDGCGDGRPWQSIVQWTTDEEGNKVAKYFGKSKLRAKVFGGGLVTATSMARTIKGAPADSDTLMADRELMARKLDDIGFHHGAHTDNHAEGENCGCGAIDKYPVITANAVKYRSEIEGALKILYRDDFEENQGAIEQAFGVYEVTANSEGYFSETSGKKSMDQIIESGAVIKELYGHHIEETIVLNDVPKTTLDQQYFTEAVKNKSKDRPKVIQAFCVDIWRGKQIAQVVTEIEKDENPNIDINETYKLAYADFLIRTLAVAATLTDGSLPVYLHSPEQ